MVISHHVCLRRAQRSRLPGSRGIGRQDSPPNGNRPWATPTAVQGDAHVCGRAVVHPARRGPFVERYVGTVPVRSRACGGNTLSMQYSQVIRHRRAQVVRHSEFIVANGRERINVIEEGHTRTLSPLAALNQHPPLPLQAPSPPCLARAAPLRATARIQDSHHRASLVITPPPPCRPAHLFAESAGR